MHEAGSRAASAAATKSSVLRQNLRLFIRGLRNARRPPELLTRDHVARAIVREVKEGRGSPHGGVFLDIAWIKVTVKLFLS